MTQEEFIATAPAGTNFTYHTGTSLSGLEPSYLWPLRKAYNDGLIDFKQRIVEVRGKVRTFAYIAEKRRYRRPPAPAYGKDRPNVAVHLFNKVG